jgi:predicted nucleotidyltransferase
MARVFISKGLKSMTVTPQITESLKLIVKIVNETMPVSAIYLFGSYANGIPNEHSDLDIYIVTPDKSKRRIDWAIQTRRAFGTEINVPIDVVVNYDDEFEHRSKINVSFEHEVATKGVNISAY